MNDQLEHEVREALAWRADRTTVRPDLRFDGRGVRPVPASRRPNWVAPAVAAAAITLVVVGLTVASGRDDGGQAVGDSSAPPTSTAITEGSTSGRMGLPAGSNLVLLLARDIDPPTSFASSATRVYATDLDHPEDGPSLIVTAEPQPEALDFSGASEAVSVAVRDGEGTLFDSPDGSATLWFFDGGVEYALHASGLSVTELVAAAESVAMSPDGSGPSVRLADLPTGMTEQFVGWRDLVFVSQVAAALPAPSIELTDPVTGGMVTYFSFADPDLARIDRLGFARTVAATVNGAPGYVGLSDMSDTKTVVWVSGTRTMSLTGDGFTDDEMLAMAESLVPVSSPEWEDMLVYEAPANLPCPPSTDTPTTVCSTSS